MPAGRKTVDNLSILAKINHDPKQRKSFDAYLTNAIHYLRQVAQAQDGYKDVVGNASETLGLSKGFINKCAKARYKDDAMEQLDMAQAIVEAVEQEGAPQEQEAEEGDAEATTPVAEEAPIVAEKAPKKAKAKVPNAETKAAIKEAREIIADKKAKVVTAEDAPKRRGRPKKVQAEVVAQQEVLTLAPQESDIDDLIDDFTDESPVEFTGEDFGLEGFDEDGESVVEYEFNDDPADFGLDPDEEF